MHVRSLSTVEHPVSTTDADRRPLQLISHETRVPDELAVKTQETWGRG